MINTEKSFETPWGRYIVLSERPNYKLKRIEVNPGHRLSYQFHKKRSEVWTIVQGSGEIMIDGKQDQISYGDCIKIKNGSKHRINNNTDSLLIFIEVQTGTYFGEDDIIRIEDDYNRVK